MTVHVSSVLSYSTHIPSTGATVMKIGTKDPKEVPQELDIALDLEYSGGCHMAVQVDLVFNKSVYLAVKLAYLRGRARLQLSRHPLTHWSLAFYEVWRGVAIIPKYAIMMWLKFVLSHNLKQIKTKTKLAENNNFKPEKK